MSMFQEKLDVANPRNSFERLLKPRSIAIVGLSDRSPFAHCVAPSLSGAAKVYFVNPKHPSVLGQKCYPSLSSLEQPIDAVMCLTSVERTVQLAEEAVDLHIGGLVAVAGGFAEVGSEGVQLQSRLAAAARRGRFEVVGPNGLGFINVPLGVSLTLAGPHDRRPGGISVVSQSGALLSGVALAAWDRPRVGTNLLISAGNEAVSDLADYVDYLVDDPETRAIGLVIEQIRRPQEFFRAVRRASEAGKPVVALKLARNSRSRSIAASHTGALVGDAWAYDVAFKDAGIMLARDPEELVDRLSLFEQLHPSLWGGAGKVGVLTMTGGFASLAVDLAEEEGLTLPELEGLEDWMSDVLPSVTVPNPLDTAGQGARIWPEIVEKYEASADLGALLFIHPLANADNAAQNSEFVKTFIAQGKASKKPFVVSNCAGAPGGFVLDEVEDTDGVAVGFGLRATLRGMQSLAAFTTHRNSLSMAPAATSKQMIPRPVAKDVDTDGPHMLPFLESMRLLDKFHIPTAPFTIVDTTVTPTQPHFNGPYAVKLADVGHRTDIGAVRLNVEPAGLIEAVETLRETAVAHKLPGAVAVQPMIEAQGEVFLGINTDSDLGPIVVFGLGGILVEALGRVGGRMAPVTMSAARDLIAEFEGIKIMHGFRGQDAWDLEELARIISCVGELAISTGDWISSIDINPLIYGPHGFVAVDALCLTRPGDSKG